MPDANFYYQNSLYYPPRNRGETEVIVKFNGDFQRVATELDFKVEILGNSYAILTLRPALLPYLHNFKEIEYIELPKTMSLILRESMSHACITSVHNQEGYGLSGEGVLVGIIDSGIDYTHPDFRDENGNSRILYFWDQTGNGTPPAGFFGGVEYTNSQFNFALSHDQPYEIIPRLDSIGHGTAVSGIIAGNGRASGGREYGVAPKASLAVVRLGKRGLGSFALTTEIMRALKYLSDKAQELNMPLVINLSFGTNNGSHLGNTLFESYINEISQQGKTVIVVAAGNEGSSGHHYSGLINQGQEIDVTFTVAAEINSLFLTFWKSFVDTFDLELITPCGERSGILNPTESFRRFKLRVTDIAVFYGQPSIYNEDQEIFLLMRAAPIPQGLWTLRVSGRQVVEGEFQIWLPTTEEVGLGVSFTAPDPNFTLTLPATAEKVISVGGYDAAIDSAADFSGRGYLNHAQPLKPDLVAPAVNILSTRLGGGYDTFTGTSMAAPFVTGSVALIMEWGIVRGNDPFLYGQRIKAFLQRTAQRDQDVSYPNPVWGYGRLCLKAALDALLAYKN